MRKKWQAEKAGLSLRATRFGRRPDFAVGPSIEYGRTSRLTALARRWRCRSGIGRKAKSKRRRRNNGRHSPNWKSCARRIAAQVTKSAEASRIARSQFGALFAGLSRKAQGFRPASGTGLRPKRDHVSSSISTPSALTSTRSDRLLRNAFKGGGKPRRSRIGGRRPSRTRTMNSIDLSIYRCGASVLRGRGVQEKGRTKRLQQREARRKHRQPNERKSSTR